jgi:hypothetical protein
MTCTVDQRLRACRAAEHLLVEPAVEYVDTFPPDEGQHHRWGLEVTIADTEVSAELLTVLGGQGLAVQTAQPLDSEHYRVVATL